MNEPDLLDPELHGSGAIDGILDELRARSPVAWRAGRRGPGYWAVTGYPELTAISTDPARFTSWWGTRPEVRRAAGVPRPLHNLDPPEHTALRRIASRFVSRDRLGALAPVTRAAATEMLARFCSGGDATTGFAIPVASRTFAAWLGVDEGDALLLFERVHAVHVAGAALLDAPGVVIHRDAAREASSTLAEWFRSSLPHMPSGTVLGDLHALVTGGELTLQTAVMLATLFVEAGLPTAIDAMLNALEHEPTRPSSIDAAIEDSLGARPPIQQFARYATEDAVVGDVPIRAGQQAILFYGAANRDPRRGEMPHVSYGAGPHRCIGATFARSLLSEALTVWYEHIPTHTARTVRRASSYQSGPAVYEVRW